MDRLNRLADILESKHFLVSEADIKDVMHSVVSNITNAFVHYIDPKTVKSKAYNGIPAFASVKEPHCLKIMGYMYKIMSQIDVLKTTPQDLYEELDKVLALVAGLDEAIKETKKKTRDFLPTQQVLNDNRSDLKRLEESLKRFSSLISQAARPLHKMLRKETPMSGGETTSEVLPLTKEQRRQAIAYDPDLANYGFNSPDIVENLDLAQRLLDEPGMGAKFDKLVRAIKRSGTTRGPTAETSAEVTAFLQFLKQRISELKQTNLPALEKMPEKPPVTFEEEGDAWDRKMARKYNDLTLKGYLK